MKISIIAAIALAIGSPSLAQKVSVEYAHQTDFSKFNTYRWGKNKGQLPDAAEDDHIKQSLDRVLQAKGLHRVDNGAAALVVTYQATVKSQQQVDTYVDDADMGMGLGWGWGGGWGIGWGEPDPTYTAQNVVTIHQGDLLVDMVDPAAKHMLFRGYSSGAFHSDPVKEDKLLGKAIDKMFKNFPPKKPVT